MHIFNTCEFIDLTRLDIRPFREIFKMLQKARLPIGVCHLRFADIVLKKGSDIFTHETIVVGRPHDGHAIFASHAHIFYFAAGRDIDTPVRGLPLTIAHRIPGIGFVAMKKILL